MTKHPSWLDAHDRIVPFCLSRGRADTITQDVLYLLNNFNGVLFVPPEEKSAYIDRIRREGLEHIRIVIECSDGCDYLDTLRNCNGFLACEGCQTVFRLDDDVKLFAHYLFPPLQRRFPRNRYRELIREIYTCFERYPALGLLGLPTRRRLHYFLSAGGETGERIMFRSRIQSCFAYRLSVCMSEEWYKENYFLEDVDAMCRIARRGKFIFASLTGFSYDNGGFGAGRGGIGETRTPLKQAKSVEFLVKTYPEFIQKIYVSGGYPRDDVRLKWGELQGAFDGAREEVKKMVESFSDY